MNLWCVEHVRWSDGFSITRLLCHMNICNFPSACFKKDSCNSHQNHPQVVFFLFEAHSLPWKNTNQPTNQPTNQQPKFSGPAKRWQDWSCWVIRQICWRNSSQLSRWRKGKVLHWVEGKPWQPYGCFLKLWYPQNTTKWSFFSRKTNSCLVPPV